MTTERPPFATGSLDRDASTRMSPELLQEAWRDPRARLLRLRGVEVPVVESGGRLRLALVATEGAYEPTAPDGSLGEVYLGRRDGAPVFARTGGDPEISGERWQHPFELGDRLDEAEGELVAVASGLIRWHESAGFSPRDGSVTSPALGGWARLDPHAGEHFPRTDPAVIVLIEHDDRILLGSNALWEAGRFSLLAGFVEAGESLEQTVVREVFEEAGIRVAEPRYVASQPWPFPRSLMLGFRTRLADGADPESLTPDPEEISELRWFSRAELRGPAPGIVLPMGTSIARWMIDRWIDEDGRRGAGS